MKRLRVSISGMMVGVVYLGFAFAALTRPTPLWAEGWLSATLVLLAFAALVAIFARRPFWAGFAIVGWGFIVLTLFPPFDEKFAPRLIIHRLAERHYRTLRFAPTSADQTFWVQWNDTCRQGRLLTSSGGVPNGRYNVTFLLTASSQGMIGLNSGTYPATSLRPISLEGFQQLCHAMVAPILALLGGIVAHTYAAGRASEPPAYQRDEVGDTPQGMSPAT
jgi:hypothetical protein